MGKRAINPKILREMVFVLNNLPRQRVGLEDAESVVRKVLDLSKRHGLYEGDYERPAKHFSPPAFVGKNGRVPKYPFYRMEVGESVFFSYAEKSAALDAARNYGNRNEMKFTHQPENDGVRIWRVS